jgi:hypothetical protein
MRVVRAFSPISQHAATPTRCCDGPFEPGHAMKLGTRERPGCVHSHDESTKPRPMPQDERPAAAAKELEQALHSR